MHSYAHSAPQRDPETLHAYRVTEGAVTLGIISVAGLVTSRLSLQRAARNQLGAHATGYHGCQFRRVEGREIAAVVGAFLTRHNGRPRHWRNHPDVILADARKGN